MQSAVARWSCHKVAWRLPGSSPRPSREELRQETGIVAAKLELLGAFNIAVGYSNQRDFAFLATGLTLGARTPDREEHDLVLHRVTLREFREKIRTNAIDDSQTLAAWAFYLARSGG
jgi:hypothetical protein